MDNHRTIHTKIEYTFFLSAQGIFSRIDHTLGHKTSLGKCKEIEIIASTFSDHNPMRLEIKYRKKKMWKHKHMEAKQYVTKQPMRHWWNQRRLKKLPRDKWPWKHNDPKPIELSKSNVKREVYSNTILPLETTKVSNKQLNLIPKATREKNKQNSKLVERKK